MIKGASWIHGVAVGIIIGELAIYGVTELNKATARAAARNEAEERTQAVTEFSHRPPFQFTGGAEVRVRFTTQSDMLSICGRGARACYDPDRQRIVTINPCYPEEDSWRSNDMTTLCHELAHANGWHHVDPRDEKLQSTRAKWWRR